MKNVNQFKKQLYPGQKWHCFNHHLNKDFGIRSVAQIGSGKVGFDTQRDGVSLISWLDFPKAKDFRSTSETSFDIYRGDTKMLSYTLVEGA